MRSGESIGHAIRLAFEVANVGCVFGNIRKLVGVPSGLRLGLFVQGRYKGLVVRIQREGAALHHVPEMTNGAEGGQELSIKWGPILLILL